MSCGLEVCFSGGGRARRAGGFGVAVLVGAGSDSARCCSEISGLLTGKAGAGVMTLCFTVGDASVVDFRTGNGGLVLAGVVALAVSTPLARAGIGGGVGLAPCGVDRVGKSA
jgi:hypothetical protein